MMRSLLYFLMVLFLATAPAWAGVVEDAEEELRKLGQGQEQHQQVTRTTRSSTTPPRPASTDRPARTNSEPVSSARPGRGSEASESGNSTAAAAATEEAPTETQRSRLDRSQKKQGRLASFGVILFLALLVGLATAAARRLGSSE
ncbi:MAG: hypothetical protein WC314_21090 [Vulcanimicrobiota bacterium]